MNTLRSKTHCDFDDSTLHPKKNTKSNLKNSNEIGHRNSYASGLSFSVIEQEEKLYSIESNVSRLAAQKLAEIGYFSVDILVTALKCDINHVAINAATSIRIIGKSAKSAVFNLAWMLHHKNKECREIAAATLGVLKSTPSVSVFVLAKALNDNERSVRQYASAALGEFKGSDLRLIQSELQSAVHQADDNVRTFAKYALSKTE